MECQTLREDLVAYLDNELLPDAATRVEAHLARCSSCAEEVRVFSQTWEVLDSYQAIKPPAGFMETFMERLAGEDTARAPVVALSGYRRVLPYLAAAALIGVVLWLGSQWLGQDAARPEVQPVAALTPEERAIVRDLPILASKQYQLLRNLKLVENYPVILNLTENDFEAL